MELTKPIYEIHQKMKEAGSEIYRKAMTGEQCANLFAKLDRSDPDIHELVNRHQFATGNDRYSVMMDIFTNIGLKPPYAFYRILERNRKYDRTIVLKLIVPNDFHFNRIRSPLTEEKFLFPI